MKYITLLLIALCSYFPVNAVATQNDTKQKVDAFIQMMVKQHHFDQKKLESIFSRLQKNYRVINFMRKPYEAKPWYQYQKIFVTQSRVDNGVKFWRNYRTVLANVSQQTGVPPQLIVAIIGVESRYGKQKGGFTALQSLYTLGFHYPGREKYFRSELAQLLLLCREQDWNPWHIKGSYAGALGQPQFMPSSYRTYAVPYNKTKKQVNLFDYEPDVIASVANYFKRHGWQAKKPIVTKAKIAKWFDQSSKLVDRSSRSVKPTTSLRQFLRLGVEPDIKTNMAQKASLIRLQQAKGYSYWLGFNNFYVITRYNKSILYAMAVDKLAGRIASKYHKQHTA